MIPETYKQHSDRADYASTRMIITSTHFCLWDVPGSQLYKPAVLNIVYCTEKSAIIQQNQFYKRRIFPDHCDIFNWPVLTKFILPGGLNTVHLIQTPLTNNDKKKNWSKQEGQIAFRRPNKPEDSIFTAANSQPFVGVPSYSRKDTKAGNLARTPTPQSTKPSGYSDSHSTLCSVISPRRTSGRAPHLTRSTNFHRRACCRLVGSRTRWHSSEPWTTVAMPVAVPALRAGRGRRGSPGHARPRASSVDQKAASCCKGAPTGTPSWPRQDLCTYRRCLGRPSPWPCCLRLWIGSAEKQPMSINSIHANQEVHR